MKKIALFLLLGVVLLLEITACQPDSTPPSDAPVIKKTHPSEAGSVAVDQPEEPTEQAVLEQEPGDVESTAVPMDDSGIATDIPIPEEAYKVQSMRKGSSVSYQVDGEVTDVVTWYQEILPQYGWEMAGPPDSAIGSIATMLRENADGERLTINMQANEAAGFVSIIIQVMREE